MKIHIAPMMGWTNRHGRALMALLSPHLRLWSDMKTADAIIHGGAEILAGENEGVVLQLGGNDPVRLAAAASKGVAAGFAAINLNMGCPSERVGSGGFGAALMLELDRAATCLAGIKDAVSVPVSVKCRIGVDEQVPEEVLPQLIEKFLAVGVRDFIIHARKAWLSGLSPRQNRTVPPLDYGLVYAMKQNYPTAQIIINGGIEDLAQADEHLKQMDGAMIGRAAFRNPFMLMALNKDAKCRGEVLEAFTAYALRENLTSHHLTHYIAGLWTGQRGAAAFRRALNDMGDLTPQSAQQLISWTQARAA